MEPVILPPGATKAIERAVRQEIRQMSMFEPPRVVVALPYDINAERAVLTTLIDRDIDPRLLRVIKPSDFHVPLHAFMFPAILSTKPTCTSPDELLFRLGRQVARAGGAELDVHQVVFGVSLFGPWLRAAMRKLRDLSKRRQALLLLTEAETLLRGDAISRRAGQRALRKAWQVLR